MTKKIPAHLKKLRMKKDEIIKIYLSVLTLKSQVLNLSDINFNLAFNKKLNKKVKTTKKVGLKIIDDHSSLSWNFNTRGKLITKMVFAGVGNPTK